MDLTISILKFAFIFISGAVVGWCIEFFWRRFFDETKRWGNPGFLNGPWLPVYGFGVLILYQISKLGIDFALLPLIFIVVLTVLEYIAGIIFIKFFKIKLWDYSSKKFNLHGLICPLYSLFWGVLGTIFYIFIYPVIVKHINNLMKNLELSFFVGFFFGIFVLDLVMSFNLAGRIKKLASEAETKFSIDYEKFKLELRDRLEGGVKNRTHFLMPFRGELGSSLKLRVNEHKEKIIKAIKKKKLDVSL